MAKLEIKDGTYKVIVDNVEVDLHVTERGAGHPFLVLHGGAGPVSVSRFADLLAASYPIRVITPTHPGFARTPRPEGMNSVRGLARVYAAFLDQLNVSDVTVIGNSIGGWIACELALLSPPQVSGIILVDAVGIEVANHPVADVSKLTPDQLMSLSYHDPKPFRIDPASLTDDQRAIIGSNRAALQIYAGPLGVDPALAGRLAKIAIPTLVLWGESDRIVDREYSQTFAASIPGAKFLSLSDTGHVPQIETPELLMETIWNYLKEGLYSS
jgi:pimeloyl-ACP methyl ester carboxylesterase